MFLCCRLYEHTKLEENFSSVQTFIPKGHHHNTWHYYIASMCSGGVEYVYSGLTYAFTRSGQHFVIETRMVSHREDR